MFSFRTDREWSTTQTTVKPNKLNAQEIISDKRAAEWHLQCYCNNLAWGETNSYTDSIIAAHKSQINGCVCQIHSKAHLHWHLNCFMCNVILLVQEKREQWLLAVVRQDEQFASESSSVKWWRHLQILLINMQSDFESQLFLYLEGCS